MPSAEKPRETETVAVRAESFEQGNRRENNLRMKNKRSGGPRFERSEDKIVGLETADRETWTNSKNIYFSKFKFAARKRSTRQRSECANKVVREWGRSRKSPATRSIHVRARRDMKILDLESAQQISEADSFVSRRGREARASAD